MHRLDLVSEDRGNLKKNTKRRKDSRWRHEDFEEDFAEWESLYASGECNHTEEKESKIEFAWNHQQAKIDKLLEILDSTPHESKEPKNQKTTSSFHPGRELVHNFAIHKHERSCVRAHHKGVIGNEYTGADVMLTFGSTIDPLGGKNEVIKTINPIHVDVFLNTKQAELLSIELMKALGRNRGERGRKSGLLNYFVRR